jgi:hypothetical protein
MTMLTPTENRRYRRQCRELDILNAKIAALERAAPYDNLSIPEAAEAAQILIDLRSQKDALWARFPRGDASCFFNPSNLYYTDSPSSQEG